MLEQGRFGVNTFDDRNHASHSIYYILYTIIAAIIPTLSVCEVMRSIFIDSAVEGRFRV